MGMADTAMWARRVDEWRQSGQSATGFTADREFSAGGLRYWAHRLKRERAASPETLVPMARVVRSLPAKEPSRALAAPTVAAESAIVVEVGAARISVRPGFDAVTLAAVVEVLAPRTGAA
jgi:hypothetical protein